jgi:hypothetical protein
MVKAHFCNEHQVRFFKNEKVDEKGQTDIWYSHKKADGTGFCQEKYADSVESVDPMLACNAMNNAVALANAGKIELDSIGDFYKKLYSELAVA